MITKPKFLFDILQLFIDNDWVDAHDGATFEDVNPANEKITAKIAEASKVNFSHFR